MKILKIVFVGFLIGSTVNHFTETLDLTMFWVIPLILILWLVYFWLEYAIEKKNKQNITK